MTPGHIGKMPDEWYIQHRYELDPKCRRDLFAAAALQGLLSEGANRSIESEAEVAVKCADALLAALDRPKEQT